MRTVRSERMALGHWRTQCYSALNGALGGGCLGGALAKNYLKLLHDSDPNAVARSTANLSCGSLELLLGHYPSVVALLKGLEGTKGQDQIHMHDGLVRSTRQTV